MQKRLRNKTGALNHFGLPGIGTKSKSLLFSRYLVSAIPCVHFCPSSFSSIWCDLTWIWEQRLVLRVGIWEQGLVHICTFSIRATLGFLTGGYAYSPVYQAKIGSPNLSKFLMLISYASVVCTALCDGVVIGTFLRYGNMCFLTMGLQCGYTGIVAGPQSQSLIFQYTSISMLSGEGRDSWCFTLNGLADSAWELLKGKSLI